MEKENSEGRELDLLVPFVPPYPGGTGEQMVLPESRWEGLFESTENSILQLCRKWQETLCELRRDELRGTGGRAP